MAKRSLGERCREAYTERARNLLRLGFQTYADYLASELWMRIRSRVLAAQYLCTGCNRRAAQVHHGSYDLHVLDGSNDRHLYPICRECHEAIEFNAAGEKVPPDLATQRLMERAVKGKRRKNPVRGRRHRHKHRKGLRYTDPWHVGSDEAEAALRDLYTRQGIHPRQIDEMLMAQRNRATRRTWKVRRDEAK